MLVPSVFPVPWLKALTPSCVTAHYGIPGVNGNDFRKVSLPAGSHRGGVMTQASIMKVTADGTRTSPVLRGKWVLERIVGQPPAPPPPDVPSLEPDIRGATSIRQQLDKHRAIAACASCHVHIDPKVEAARTLIFIPDQQRNFSGRPPMHQYLRGGHDQSVGYFRISN